MKWDTNLKFENNGNGSREKSSVLSDLLMGSLIKFAKLDKNAFNAAVELNASRELCDMFVICGLLI